jgi:hypothetical protein
MSINKEGHEDFVLSCDICCTETSGFSDFDEARIFSKNNGWAVKKINEEWVNICPSCVDEMAQKEREKRNTVTSRSGLRMSKPQSRTY